MVGGILILMGLIVLAVPIFFEVDTEFSKVLLVSGIPIVIGVIMISTYSGTLIEFENHKFREYQSILWIKFGDWQNLPKIENAELIHYTYTQTNTPNGISPTLSGEVTVYKCVLVSGGKKFMVFDYSKEKDAIVALDIIRNGFRL
jgi:hypothetical protein